MLQSGRVAFGAMETVVFGKPAAETVAEEARRRDAERVFLMVSGTLNRTTDEIAKVRRALGNRFAGLFDHMPPHTPRHAVIEAAEMAREAGADLIVTVGGGSITDGAKAVQLCLANNVRNAEAIGGLRPVKGPDGALGPPPDMKPPSVRQVTVPTTLSAGEFSAYSGITDERHRIKELFRHPYVIPRAVVLDPAVTVHTPEWLFLSTGVRAVDHCVEGICSGEANPMPTRRPCTGCRCSPTVFRGLRPTPAISRPGSIAKPVPGCRWRRSPAACPWGRATASATCWAPCSTSHTATPRASCCRR